MSAARLEHTLNVNSAGGFGQDTADESLFNAVTLQEKERQTDRNVDICTQKTII